MSDDVTYSANGFRLPFGGEIWHQKGRGCHTVYIVTGIPTGEKYSSKMAMSTDPREMGNTISHWGSILFEQDDLASYLHENEYECQGNLYDLIEERESDLSYDSR